MCYKHFTGICRKCRELIRTRKTDEDVLEAGALHELLGKMTVVSNDFVLVCTSNTNTNTTPVPAVRYNCTQNSSVSRAQIEVTSYEQSNVKVGRRRSTNSSSNCNPSKRAANLNYCLVVDVPLFAASIFQIPPPLIGEGCDFSHRFEVFSPFRVILRRNSEAIIAHLITFGGPKYTNILEIRSSVAHT